MGLSIGSDALLLALIVVSVSGNNEGVAIWADGSQKPGYSLWDGNELSTPQKMRDTGGSWKVIRADYSPIRDEAIVIGVTDDQMVTALSYSGSQWSDRATAAHWWGFDVRYESRSGNPLLVWHEGPTDTVRYAMWRGSMWSLGTIPTPIRGGEHDELKLVANPKSNEMVLVVGAGSGGSYVIVWNGESWGGGIVLKNADNPDATNDVNVSFEQQRGRAVIIYGDGSMSLKYQIWNGLKWSGEESVSPPAGIQNRISRAAISSDPSTNRLVAAVTSYPDNTFWVTVWDGNATWGSKAVLVASGSSLSSLHVMAVAFEGTSQHALATYAQADNEVKYRTWSSSTDWSDEEQGPDVGARPKSMMLYSDKESNNVMLAVQSNDSDISFCKWSGAEWSKVSQMTNITPGERLNKTQPFVFMWNKPVKQVASKSEVEQLIQGWYESNPEQYSLTVHGEEAKAAIERYYPMQEEKKNNLIRVRWKGMTITLAFVEPLEDIEWTPDGLQTHFSYVELDHIASDIEAEGWDIAPRTPSSSLRNGVTFQVVNEFDLKFEVRWSLYAVLASSKSELCQSEMRLVDKPLPADCYVHVRKNLPLHINVNVPKP